MYAIVAISGHQYKVTPNDTIIVDRLTGEKGTEIQFPEVLLVSDEKSVTVGTPYVAGVTIVATIADHIQGENLRVSRFKAKSRYRKTIGFRAQQTTLVIKSIGQTTAPKTTAKKTEKSVKRQKAV